MTEPRLDGGATPLPSADELLSESEDQARVNAKLARDARLKEMNEKHAVIENYGGRCLITDLQPNPVDTSLMRITLVRPGDLCLRYHNLSVSTVTSGDKKSYRELGKWWLAHRNRRQYAGLLLVPGDEKVISRSGRLYLNLWEGWGIEPRAGDWSLMRWHIEQVLANGDPLAAEYILKFAAWAVQHPSERAEAALVFRGGKGSGKGTFAVALKRCFGKHGLHISDQEHLTGKFNGHFRDCILLVADEAYWAGDKRAEGALKRMITEPTLMLEEKYVNGFEWPNMLHIIMTANEEWVVPASHDERRFAVFEVSEEKIGDEAYFKALHAEMDKGGGLAAMLWDLRQMPLGDWHPRQVYKTEALRAQQEYSLPPVAEFIEMILQDGIVPGALAGKPWRVPFEKLRYHACRRHPFIGRMSEKKLAMELEKLGVRADRDGAVRYRDFLPIAEARAAFEKRYPGWPWRDAIGEWIAPETITSVMDKGL